MPKRKSTSASTQDPIINGTSNAVDGIAPPPLKRRASARHATTATASTNPDLNANVLDAPQALRASPDASGKDERLDVEKAAGASAGKQIKEEELTVDIGDNVRSEPKGKKPRAKQGAKKSVEKEVKVEDTATGEITKPKKDNAPAKEPAFLDPEADGEEEADEAELKEALYRPPPVHSDYLPLPWKGRLGYVGHPISRHRTVLIFCQACLCTYLRFSNPPVFSSRTCRIASILENRHPLKDPDVPPHATKNRPDKDKPADIALGQAFVESLGKANAKDIVKMLRWNEKYGIRFLRLSSEMFPFASHEEYGYKLAPFVSEELAEAGRLAAKLGHRLTTHPGQYTQLGSPRKQVIDNAIRDLDYHAELLDLLKLPPQQNRDAVMILHLGGVFGDKEATINRFKENYARLPQNVKNRLVLENDDVSWSVHELLPICEELNIPMVLDFHHHNIIFDSDKVREGTKDVVDLFPRILATWRRKNITPKMHYSEPTPEAITGRQRRKHNPRVATLPPCPPDMDLMIEAKDKEQAVFELMRTFKLPGHHLFNDITPHVRNDDNKPVRTPKRKAPKKSKKVKEEDEDVDEANNSAEEPVQQVIPDEEVGMGGPDRRVYWPPGQEHWLRPVKKVVKPKKEADSEGDAGKKLTPAQKKKAAAEAAKEGAKVEEEVQANGIKSEGEPSVAGTPTPTPTAQKVKGAAKSKANGSAKKGSKKKKEETPAVTSEDEDSELSDMDMDDLMDEDVLPAKKSTATNGSRAAKSKRPSAASGRRQSGRAKKVVYAEGSDENEDE